jgi:hypothetical protein
MLNKKEKEELVVKLLEEDKTYKEISNPGSFKANPPY